MTELGNFIRWHQQIQILFNWKRVFLLTSQFRTSPYSESEIQWQAPGKGKSRRKGSVGRVMCAKCIYEINPDQCMAATASQPAPILILKLIDIQICIDPLFGTWNIRTLYRAGLLMTVSKELSQHRVSESA